MYSQGCGGSSPPFGTKLSSFAYPVGKTERFQWDVSFSNLGQAYAGLPETLLLPEALLNPIKQFRDSSIFRSEQFRTAWYPVTLYNEEEVRRCLPMNGENKIPPMILVVSKEANLADIRARILKAAGYGVESAMDLNTFQTLCQAHPKVDLVIIGYSLPMHEKRRVWEAAKKACKDTPILELYEHGRHELLENNKLSIHEYHTEADFLAAVKLILQVPTPAIADTTSAIPALRESA
jgi:CheY-like chemotaxis protein